MDGKMMKKKAMYERPVRERGRDVHALHRDDERVRESERQPEDEDDFQSTAQFNLITDACQSGNPISVPKIKAHSEINSDA